ncbi:antibiotic biosynthesis monooxygenase [Pandoraea apista]|uniref:Antibiotic biosynthesis monooxygenase n=1 Tax=Pandoraea apista TaxID=93218 RepID=A0A0G4JC04_9BURK|nr:antibiotic biosynthesis monooxygenase [Pandoraea apista]OXS89078.1 antibiotic biosynthesis monooxygenase [Pandoraea apista]PTE01377.1 antibiotic biosynthesis monooxygenase [Pandoraea apista]RRJ30907.1 antibiotic biosynthesis monooxygenase [Pandoraea apista]RRJ79514.1 antibiotic biosynthesis monooxygenase [Pandoraea apista]RRW97082.1 antibiotic biosynthesis monooxygenase [Pandoraea apista]
MRQAETTASADSMDPRDPSLRRASLGDLSARSLPRPESVTAVIEHHVRPEAVAAYEAWLKRIVPIAERFPGHRGVHVIRPASGSTVYTVTLRFDSLAHAEDWFQSDARQTLLGEVTPFLASDERRQTVTGLEFWFHPAPGQKPAKRYKQFLLTLSVIFPLTVVVPLPVHWLAPSLPWLTHTIFAKLVVAAIIVGLMTYVIMPRVTRLASRWLYE